MVVTMDALVMSNASFLRYGVVMTLKVLVRSLFNIDLVMDGLLSPLAWLVVSELMLNLALVSFLSEAGLMTVLSTMLILDIQVLD